MNEMFSIAGKVAVITGAGGVLGGSVARSFVKEGAKVVALDLRQEQVRLLLHSIMWFKVTILRMLIPLHRPLSCGAHKVTPMLMAT